MKGNIVLCFLAYLLTTSMCAVIKKPAHEPKKNESLYDIFSRIIEVNKGLRIPLIGGDIKVKLARSAINCTTCLWPKSADGTVYIPYALSNTYSTSDVNLITSSMQEFETLTCVKFIPRTTEKDFIQIVTTEGCTSFVGRTGGNQSVGLQTTDCIIRGIIQHELHHVLGFYHEHTRSDRDAYVDIKVQYISPNNLVNFNIQSSNNLGLGYDYGSVMHYDKFAFSNTSNQPSIVPKPDPNVLIGQRIGLSVLDVSKINTLYQCNLCATLLNNKDGTVTSPNYPNSYPNNIDCVWLIRTPTGQVTLNLDALDIQSSSSCLLDYIKIYDGPSKTSPVLLDRTCGTGLVPLLVASSNQMLVEFFSDDSITGAGFSATYNSVPCGGNYWGFPKDFTSPGYPVAYPPYMDCTFNITAPVGFRVLLSVSDFHLESATYCMYDYMKVQSGSDTYGPFCGDYNVPSITSTGNFLKVIFHSDESNQLKGFHASYTFI